MMQFIKTAFLFLAGFACLMPAGAQESKPAASALAPPAAPLREAQEFYLHGDFEKAVAKYNDVLQGNPQSAEAYSGIVRSYLKQNRVGDADTQLQKALQVLPSDSGLKVAQGELLFRQGKIPEAEKTFVELINSGHASARAYLGLANVSLGDRYVRARISVYHARSSA
jgi:predicted Zn-dependent protease